MLVNCAICILIFVPLITASCQSNFTEFESNCYFVSSNLTKFAAAELICREKGGHLASIHDIYTNAFIAQLALKLALKSDLWIGLTNLKELSSWKWTDKSDLDFQNWNNDSNLNTSNKNCASFSITDKHWYPDDCDKIKSFVCQNSKEPICEDGFVYLPATKSCYGGRGSPGISWTHAEEFCKTTYNAHLPSSESFTEFQFVATYISAVAQAYWTGIRFSNESQTWVTVNGTEPEFLKWCSNNPKQETAGRCVYIFYDSASPFLCYIDEECGNPVAFLCKKGANIDFKYRNCPPGFLEWNSKCYFASQSSSEFDEAELSCIEMGGNLASIHNGFENAFISQIYNGATPDVWIGLSSKQYPKEWQWVDNSSFNYENWKETEFANVSKSKCVSAYLTDGKWTAGDCDKNKQFVCETEYKVPNCSDGSFYFLANEACYGNGNGKITRYTRGYYVAQKYCLNWGANLPSIHSEYELQLMLSFAYVYWCPYWLGIRSFDGGETWETDDGSAADFLDYGKWCDGFSQELSDEQCVAVQPLFDGRGCYRAANCTNLIGGGFYSICKKSVTSVTSLSTTANTVRSSQFSTYDLSTTSKPTSASTLTSAITSFLPNQHPRGIQKNTSKLFWYIGGGSAVIIVFIIIIILLFTFRLRRKNRQKKLNELFHGLFLGSSFGQLMNQYTEYSSVMLERDELEIDFSNALGKGSNSIVYKANFKPKHVDKPNVAVAVKIPVSYEKEDINLFKLELDAYVRIGMHPHIITFYGWILYENAPAIVSELATQNLLEYVRSFRKNQIPTTNFISILSQISQALKHVAASNKIHRDVACRNILMINNDYVKLADFGLCCKCNETESYYAASRKKLPFKWLSIEALTRRKFSEKSDVWAFGVLCYEMFSCGNESYSNYSNDEVLEFLESEKRMTIPKETPEPISLMITNCWNENPDDRPTFAILEQRIREILVDETAKYGYISVNEVSD